MKAVLKCVECGDEFSLSSDLLTCPRHDPHYGYLEVVYDYQSAGFSPPRKAHCWSDYLEVLPFDEVRISFAERCSPLLPANRFGASYGLKNVYIKDESRNPTGSFKDRHSFCVTNVAFERGGERLHVASSGNAAYSSAAYARRAGLSCLCVVPQKTSQEKKNLIALSGGELVEHHGGFEDTYRAVCDSAPVGWNTTPGLNPFSEEGVKLIGYEIWQEIGVPDVVVVPCGNGSLLAAIYKAYCELKQLGLVQRLPRLIGVQIKGAAPLKRALELGQPIAAVTSPADSIAEAIVASESYSSPKVMKALQATGGTILEVDDDELYSGLFEVMETEGILPELSSGAAFAAISHMRSRKLLENSSETVVIVNTAGGMKNAASLLQYGRRNKDLLSDPQTVLQSLQK